jgi:hypothetical protein
MKPSSDIKNRSKRKRRSIRRKRRRHYLRVSGYNW